MKKTESDSKRYITTPLEKIAYALGDVGWKKGIRAEGFACGSTRFGMKVGTGLGTAMLGCMVWQEREWQLYFRRPLDWPQCLIKRK